MSNYKPGKIDLNKFIGQSRQNKSNNNTDDVIPSAFTAVTIDDYTTKQNIDKVDDFNQVDSAPKQTVRTVIPVGKPQTSITSEIPSFEDQVYDRSNGSSYISEPTDNSDRTVSDYSDSYVEYRQSFNSQPPFQNRQSTQLPPTPIPSNQQTQSSQSTTLDHLINTQSSIDSDDSEETVNEMSYNRSQAIMNNVSKATNDFIAKNVNVKNIVKRNVIKIKDTMIQKRLEEAKEYIYMFTMVRENVKVGFYNILSFVQAMYVTDLPNDDTITISNDWRRDVNTDITSVPNASLIDLLLQIVGPSPTNLDSRHARSDMVKISGVINVGVTSSTSNSKLFYCLLRHSTDFSRENLISYVKRGNIIENGANTMYSVYKYTDRPHLRLFLHNQNLDELTKNLYCFILENIGLFKIASKYVIQTDEYVILDIYSLVNNIIARYSDIGNILDYNALDPTDVATKRLRHNYCLEDIAIDTKVGHVNNSLTFAHAYWLYTFRYIGLPYNDRTWFREYVRSTDYPHTNLDSNLTQLCSYCVQRLDDTYLWDPLNPNIQLPSSLKGEDIDMKMAKDLETFYEMTSQQNKDAIAWYIGQLSKQLEGENTIYDLYYIYPLIFGTLSRNAQVFKDFISEVKLLGKVERHLESVAYQPILPKRTIVKDVKPYVDTDAIKLAAEVQKRVQAVKNSMDRTVITRPARKRLEEKPLVLKKLVYDTTTNVKVKRPVYKDVLIKPNIVIDNTRTHVKVPPKPKPDDVITQLDDKIALIDVEVKIQLDNMKSRDGVKDSLINMYKRMFDDYDNEYIAWRFGSQYATYDIDNRIRNMKNVIERMKHELEKME